MAKTLSAEPFALGGGAGFAMGIVGEASYGEELRRIAGQRQAHGESVEFTVTLIPEPENEYDKNAITVLSDRGQTIGYLSRQDAVNYHSAFEALKTTRRVGQCRAKMFGGTDAKPCIGVWLDIDSPTALLARLTSAEPSTTLPTTDLSAYGEIDPHGQPYEIRFNRARRAERDLSEFLGLAKGVLADGVVTDVEAQLTKQWVDTHPDAAEQWPMPAIIQRLHRIFADGEVDKEEREDLAELLGALVGGTAGVIVGHDAPTALPLDTPPPVFVWAGAVYVFTGKFAYGTRADCQREVVRRGGSCTDQITKKTDYVVIGTFGSRDWVHTSFGRKIQKAADYRSTGQRLFIVSEDHWGAAVAGPSRT